jgi:hypothetical protein
MSSSWTRAFGLSMAVCLIMILAAPALAAGPAHVRTGFPVLRGTGSAGLHLLTSFEVVGLPVVGPLAALVYAERAIRRFVFPSSTRGVISGNLPSGIGRTFNRSTLPLYPASRSANGTLAVGFAANLTAYLGEKGYNVTDLDGALTDARTALQTSNLTEFRSAMGSFRRDLGAKIAAGTINRTVIEDYLKTLPAPNPVAAERGIYGRGLRIPVHGGW